MDFAFAAAPTTATGVLHLSAAGTAVGPTSGSLKILPAAWGGCGLRRPFGDRPECYLTVIFGNGGQARVFVLAL
jgi:hypothetical protein